ncbi:L,D-transpeptidase [Streptococcus sp. CSL10205-OR2]|uniref:L,D-transpeptidase n=1 Tax=Streptococcus sp. CSL10205-OR2 TaxID=2980558 RepID=UPI0021D98F0A|nr:L,D-transpeptidase [Streptococcus sp. CSL10205-OR2]MCU9533089.1 L,D-transpeptidase [Streptococcus sp. CSL10205-OR2]
MRQKRSPITLIIIVVVFLLVGGYATYQVLGKTGAGKEAGKPTVTVAKKTSTEDKEVSSSVASTTSVEATQEETPLTEQVADTASVATDAPRQEESFYPDLAQYNDLSIKVSIAEQKMSILSGNQVIFSTVVSTGAPDSPTPTGQFIIEPERGDFFFNEASGEGAYYWVSFKDHGLYLFHSLPTDRYGNEIPEEAARLGMPSSHGCVRMPRETAKWFYENIPSAIPVQIN